MSIPYTDIVQEEVFDAIRDRENITEIGLGRRIQRVYEETKISDEDARNLASRVTASASQYPHGIVESLVYRLHDPNTFSTDVECSARIRASLVSSPLDARLGVTERNSICTICSQGCLKCGGHITMIKFPDSLKIILPYGKSASKIVSVLNSICMYCSRPLLSGIQLSSTRNIVGLARLSRIEELSKKQKSCRHRAKCARCGEQMKSICEEEEEEEGRAIDYAKTKFDLDQLIESVKKGEKTDIFSGKCPIPHEVKKCSSSPKYVHTTAQQRVTISAIVGPGSPPQKTPLPDLLVYQILDGISDEDAKLLGFIQNHPRTLVLGGMVFIPIPSRPPIIQEDVSYINDMTKAYIEISKLITSYETAEIQGDEGIAAKHKAYAEIVRQITEFYSNKEETQSVGTNRVTKGLEQQINGKAGIPKQHIFSHRGNMSARSVLTGDPNIPFGKIGIPKIIANILTVPVRVAIFNMETLQTMLINGKIKRVYRASEQRTITMNEDMIKTFILRKGDVCDRNLMNGDTMIVNRAPSLQRQNIIALEAIIQDTLSIRLHLANTTGMNADFDGDEAYLAALQSIQARSEGRNLLSMRECLMSAHDNKPIASVVFDSLVGAYILTEEGKIITNSQFFNCLNQIMPYVDIEDLVKRGSRFNAKILDGNLLFSALLPRDFNYHKGDSNSMDPEAYVKIIDGILVFGRIGKRHIGNSSGSIVQVLYKEYGPDTTIQFITNAYFCLETFINTEGFTIGQGDCIILNEKVRREIENEMEKLREDVIKVEKSIAGKSIQKEHIITELMKDSKVGIEKIIYESMDSRNPLRIAAASEAKGSRSNITQIHGTLQQQFTEGGRMKPVATENNRTLCYYEPGDIDPTARGYCTHGFTEGLTLEEFIFHAAGGREGLVDTAVKTATLGANSNQIMKFMQDIKIDGAGAAIDSKGHIIQPLYGNDGFSADKLLVKKSEGLDTRYFINIDNLIHNLNSELGFILERTDVSFIQEIDNEESSYEDPEEQEEYDNE